MFGEVWVGLVGGIRFGMMRMTNSVGAPATHSTAGRWLAQAINAFRAEAGHFDHKPSFSQTHTHFYPFTYTMKLLLLVAFTGILGAYASCENGCSGHGHCGLYDMPVHDVSIAA